MFLKGHAFNSDITLYKHNGISMYLREKMDNFGTIVKISRQFEMESQSGLVRTSFS